MKLNVGLVKGRHQLPVDYYVFGEIKDVTATTALYEHAHSYLTVFARKEGIKHLNTTVSLHNQADYTDIPVIVYDATLTIYVTGLTVALIAVLQAATELFLHVELMHYNVATGEYYPQHFSATRK